jgi:hypothetical protein
LLSFEELFKSENNNVYNDDIVNKKNSLKENNYAHSKFRHHGRSGHRYFNVSFVRWDDEEKKDKEGEENENEGEKEQEKEVVKEEVKEEHSKRDGEDRVEIEANEKENDDDNNSNKFKEEVFYLPDELLPLYKKVMCEVLRQKQRKKMKVKDEEEGNADLDKDKEEYEKGEILTDVKEGKRSANNYNEDEEDDDDVGNYYYFSDNEMYGVFDDDDDIIVQERYTALEDFMMGDEYKKHLEQVVRMWNVKYASYYGIHDSKVSLCITMCIMFDVVCLL